MLNYNYDHPAFDTQTLSGEPKIVPLAAHRNPMERWNILLVEDDPSDAALVEISLRATHIPYQLHKLAAGREVLHCLTGHCEPDFTLPPDMVILDLSLPDKDGFEILAEMAAGPMRKCVVPFVILTGFEHYRYILQTYDLWIPAYITKPCTTEKILQAFASLGRPH